MGKDSRQCAHEAVERRAQGNRHTGAPFTGPPTWAMDHVIHVHRVVYLTKPKPAAAAKYERFVKADEAEAETENNRQCTQPEAATVEHMATSYLEPCGR